MGEFKLAEGLTPKGDQPKAIKAIVEGYKRGLKLQTLKGVTGSGKTFSVANIIENKAFILRKQGRDVHQQYATENASFKILGRLRNFERLHALESIDPDLNVFNQEIDDAFGIQ